MKKMLLADDSVTIQKVVELTFDEEDFDVIAVGNGEQAIEIFDEIQPDVVLADVYMPGRNGFAVCEYVKSHPLLAHTPVILLVGTFEPFDQAEAARVHSDGFLAKPFEAEQLIQLVRDLVKTAEISSLRSSTSTEEFDIDSDSPEVEQVPVASDETVLTVEEHALESESAANTDWDWPDNLSIAEDGDSILELFDEDLPSVEVAVSGTNLGTEQSPNPALSESEIESIVERVVKRVTEGVVREVVWEVVPEMAEILIKEQLKSQQHIPVKDR